MNQNIKALCGDLSFKTQRLKIFPSVICKVHITSLVQSPADKITNPLGTAPLQAIYLTGYEFTLEERAGHVGAYL